LLERTESYAETEEGFLQTVGIQRSAAAVFQHDIHAAAPRGI
jgi:hypothetical protein